MNTLAFQQSQNQFIEIYSNPILPDDEKDMLKAQQSEILAEMIREATRFITQLNDDMQIISKDINLITSSGQDFIQRHLEQFQLIGMSSETTALLENSTEKLVSFEK